MNRKFISSVAGASLFLAVMGLLGRGIGFVKEVVFASYFGLSEDFDIYLVSAVLPLTIDVILYFIGQNYFIPTFHKDDKDTKDNKNQLVRFSFWAFTFLGFLISIVLYLFSYQIVSTYLVNLSQEKIDQAIQIFRIFLITIPLSSAISILTAFLHSKFDFSSPGYSRLFLNAAIILITILFTDKLNIFVIPVGHIIGTIFQLAYLLVKSKVQLFGNIYSNVLVKKLLKGSLLIAILIESISQLYLISDRYFIGLVDEGGIAALSYAQTFFLLPISIITIALSTAILPKLSKNFAEGNSAKVESSYNDGVNINLFMFVPLTIIYFLNGDILIQFIYERGNFSPSDTILTYNALKFFALSFIFYSTYSLSNKLIYSTNLSSYLLYITVIGIGIKILLNFLLIDSMKQNGLAIATAVSYVFFFSSSLIVLKSKRIIRKNKFTSILTFQVFNSILSLILVRIIAITSLTNLNNSRYLEVFLFLAIYFLNQMFIKTRSAELMTSLFFRLYRQNGN